MNAIILPSGESAGSYSPPGSVVSGREVYASTTGDGFSALPACFLRQTSPASPARIAETTHTAPNKSSLRRLGGAGRDSTVGSVEAGDSGGEKSTGTRSTRSRVASTEATQCSAGAMKR